MRILSVSVMLVAAAANAVIAVVFILWCGALRLVIYGCDAGAYAASSHYLWAAKNKVPPLTWWGVMTDIADDCTAMIQGVVWSVGAVAVTDCTEDETAWRSGETARSIATLHPDQEGSGDE